LGDNAERQGDTGANNNTAYYFTIRRWFTMLYSYITILISF